ncbi:hypothetical protein M0P65_03255 [Candidatus Gracilibacteria bacterium]|nr:hypothetical protein [Candidatus Gracilibacteria bacterium]
MRSETNSLDFTCQLSSEEMAYTEASLNHIKEEIIGSLDIFKVAKGFGLKLKKLPKNSKIRKEYGIGEETYTSNCPLCDNKSSLLLFRNNTFGCINHHRDGPYDNSMNIFRLVARLQGDSFNHYENDYEGIKKIIIKLFRLFPKELSFLKGHNLNRLYYKNYYFSQADKYYKGIEEDLEITNIERIRYIKMDHEQRETGNFNQEDYHRKNQLEKKCSELYYIIEGYKVVSAIYARKEKVDALLHGKTLSEVLGCEVADECEDCNKEFLSVSEEYEDVCVENATQYLQDELDEKNKEEERIKNEEIARKKAEKEAEEKRLQEIALAKIENPSLLLQDLILNNQEISNFFQSCNYDVICEGDSSLEIGDFGKFVVVFQVKTSTFSVVFGKNKVIEAPPKTIKDAEILTLTNNIPSGTGLHKNIIIPDGSSRFGGAQFIILPDNNIIIGGYSGDFGNVPSDIVKDCLGKIGYTVHFLGNTHYLLNGIVYRKIMQNKNN